MQAHFCVDDQFAFDIVFGQFDEYESRRGVWLVQGKKIFLNYFANSEQVMLHAREEYLFQ